MADYLVPALKNINGGNGRYPLSRRDFERSLPRRMAVLEENINSCELRFDGGDILLAAIEARLDGLDIAIEHLAGRLNDVRPVIPVPDLSAAVRIGNLVEIVSHLSEQVRRIDRRSAKSRRRVAVIADQVEASLIE
jgi:hypothetical protein